jgi:hypothetical protein
VNKSESTKEIFAALAKAQAAMTAAHKSSEGHGYNYADLATCIQTAKKPMEDNGLAVTQLIGQSEQGNTLETVLVHSSGEWVSSEFVMPLATLAGAGKNNPAQCMGSAITYMRRYAFAAIIGLAQSDDDAASMAQKPQQRQQKPVKGEPELQAKAQALIDSMWDAMDEASQTWCTDVMAMGHPQTVIDHLSKAKGS